MAQHRSRLVQLVICWSILALLPAGLAAAQQPESHTVRDGDTLWDIAAQYLGDPFLWPDIYRLNTDVVEDPHWIYPDEVLRLTGGADVVAVPDQQPAVPSPEGDPLEVEVVVEGAGEPEGPIQVATDQQRDMEPAIYRPMATRRRLVIGDTLVLNPLILEDPEPIVASEFYSAGWLTERRLFPFGRMRGQVTPSEIGAGRPQVNLFDLVGVTPPKGGSYQVGDSLLLIHFGREIEGFGNVLVPTGIVRVVEVSEFQATSEIIKVFQGILPGQFALPLPVFDNPGKVTASPVADGITASVIVNRNRVELTVPLAILFLDKGREEGVRLGDIFEIRRVPARRDPIAATIDELMAVVQIVHVNDHTASAQVINVVFAEILPGAAARQVGRLPS